MDADELAVAAAERERLRGRDPGEAVADDCGPGVVRNRVGDEGDAGLQHVDLDAMAAAAALALEQRTENAVAGKHAGGVVRDRGAARLRALRIELQAGD